MSFRSPFPDVEIPDVSIPELLFGDITQWADRPAMVDGTSGQSITYGQLSVLVGQVAGANAAKLGMGA